MAKRVFFLECAGEFWLEAAQLLQDERHWQILLWAAGGKFVRSLKRAFPQAQVIDTVGAVRGQLPLPLASWARPVDAALLAEIGPHQTAALKMMDRLDGALDFNPRLRQRHLHRLLGQWAGILDHLRPELVVFSEPPHVVYDYLVYALCLGRGIATVMFPANPVFPWMALPSATVEFASPRLNKAHAACLSQPDPGALPLDLRALAYMTQAALPPDQARLNPYVADRLGGKQGLAACLDWARRWQDPRTWPQGLRSQLFDPAPPTYEKQAGRLPELPFSSGLAWRRAEARGRRWRRRLKKTYDRLCSDPDLSQPYIYVALHYQPEQTTSPSGGVYVHQDLMVGLLASHLPSGWKIYVKEHGLQFAARRGHFGRGPEFYRDLAALPGVQLVPAEYSGFALMDQARAVATVTGTTGFEALCRSKPVLLFGSVWYQTCQGVLPAATGEQLAQSLTRVQNGFTPQPDKLRAFVAAFHQAAYPACPDSFRLRKVNISTEENAAAICQALADFCG